LGAGTWAVLGAIHFTTTGTPALSIVRGGVALAAAGSPTTAPTAFDSDKPVAHLTLPQTAAAMSNSAFNVARIITTTAPSTKVALLVTITWSGGTTPVVQATANSYMTAVRIA
jgi:hypothetical protein